MEKSMLLALILIILCPFVFAHEPTTQRDASATSERAELDIGPLGGNTNDLSRISPIHYALDGAWGKALFFLLFWAVLAGGVAVLFFLIVSSFVF